MIWKVPVIHDLLLKICNHTFFQTSMPPSAWQKSGIIPVPKKGDLTLASNYRDISLMKIAFKIYNKLLLIRLVPAVDPLLRDNQNGFRRVCSNTLPSTHHRGNEKSEQGIHNMLCRLPKGIRLS